MKDSFSQNVKACRDCKHYDGHSLCSADPRLIMDYETGEEKVINISIYTLRANHEKCGHEGTWWEAK